LRGYINWRRVIRAKRPCWNSFWRYLPENIEELSRRFAQTEASLPDHDVNLQFGIAGLPNVLRPLVCHVEIAVEVAASNPVFAKAYGFSDVSERELRRAIEGERYFLDRCSIVWTNSCWTAEGLLRQGVPKARIRVWPPGCQDIESPVPQRQWDRLHILFVGSRWESKGGPLLLAAFRRVRSRVPAARLTIVGCRPRLQDPAVTGLGFLRKDHLQHRELLTRTYSEATIFCMPSPWESTGIVYMEAALTGLPVVMLRGQGRDRIFPESMAVHVDAYNADALAEALLQLHGDPSRMQSMGAAGREHVRGSYIWPLVARRVVAFLREAPSLRR
jgi:glycosyltransferase involved in cell wall biosynthesis